jgi:hypothetical protein
MLPGSLKGVSLNPTRLLYSSSSNFKVVWDKVVSAISSRIKLDAQAIIGVELKNVSEVLFTSTAQDTNLGHGCCITARSPRGLSSNVKRNLRYKAGQLHAAWQPTTTLLQAI